MYKCCIEIRMVDGGLFVKVTAPHVQMLYWNNLDNAWQQFAGSAPHVQMLYWNNYRHK